MKLSREGHDIRSGLTVLSSQMPIVEGQLCATTFDFGKSGAGFLYGEPVLVAEEFVENLRLSTTRLGTPDTPISSISTCPLPSRVYSNHSMARIVITLSFFIDT